VYELIEQHLGVRDETLPGLRWEQTVLTADVQGNSKRILNFSQGFAQRRLAHAEYGCCLPQAPCVSQCQQQLEVAKAHPAQPAIE
jgi:hypothetical protein